MRDPLRVQPDRLFEGLVFRTGEEAAGMLALGDRVNRLSNRGELGLRISKHQEQQDVAMLGLRTHEFNLEWGREATVIGTCNAGGVASMGM